MSSFDLGILGNGQLAQMSAISASRLGISVATYGPNTKICPARLSTQSCIEGDLNDINKMNEFYKSCKVISLENEFISSDILNELDETFHGKLKPQADVFRQLSTKLNEKKTFEAINIPVTPYKEITCQKDLKEFGKKHGFPFIVKASHGGYDGKGNIQINSHDTDKAFKYFSGKDIFAEPMISWSKELAIQVARNASGDITIFPVCETIQKNHICETVIAPADVGPNIHKKIQDYAVRILKHLNAIGIYAFEFFLTKQGDILLNESAPRPHNSGHYTINACNFSQFDAFICSVLGLPLKKAFLQRPYAIMLNLLSNLTSNYYKIDNTPQNALKKDNVFFNFYGKEGSSKGRKMGHVTLIGDNMDDLKASLHTLRKELL